MLPAATPIVAGFFGTLLIFLLAGLGALAVTAILDRWMGKERALLLYAAGIVALTWTMKPAPPPPVTAKPSVLKFEPRIDPVAPLRFAGDVFARTPLKLGDRNTFREHSDTNPLPPVELTQPPGVLLQFPLPPTVPGVGPAGRRVYRGALPTVAAADGSKLPQIPADTFTTYVTKPEDVFDWVMQGEKRFYIYILSIDGVSEGHDAKPEYDGPKGLKWCLALRGEPPAFEKDWKSLTVKYAAIGSEAEASKYLNDVRKAKSRNITDAKSEQFAKPDELPAWFLRRSVDNLFAETCRAHGSPTPDGLPYEALKIAATEMARVGETGKEDGAGWHKAVDLLELAQKKGQIRDGAAFDATDILLALVEAHRALHDERAILSTLAAYSEKQDRADGESWIGEVFLENLFLPAGAHAFFQQALVLDPALRAAWIGKGDALTLLGDFEGALEAYRKAGTAGRGTGPDLPVREAEALLHLGRLGEAKRKVDEALSAAAFDPRALVAKGAIQYAQGDVAGARDTFAQAAALPGEGGAGASARRHRAEALMNLGLSEWRLGHGDAAKAAYEAAETALRTGAQRGRSPDEAVSPELGRALLSLSAGNDGEAVEALERSRAEAPGIAYAEMLSGVLSVKQGDATAARRSFERALALDPQLAELDGWIAEVRLKIAEGASAAGVPAAESEADFVGAIAFGQRGAVRERGAENPNPDLAVREALARLKDQHLSERKRFEAARKTAQSILDGIAREEPRALSIKGFCNYRLGPYGTYKDERGQEVDPYSECLRNFQQVVDVTGATPTSPFRKYAQDCLEAVKHWQSLEEKILTFTERFGSDWKFDEGNGEHASPDMGRLRFWDIDRTKGAGKDGSIDAATAWVKSNTQFDKATFERLELMVWIPKQDRNGTNINTVTFGIQIQGPTTAGGAGTRVQGIGLYYDKGKMAIRVGGGMDALYKDGDVHRLQVNGADREWPDSDAATPVRIEIERTDPRDGKFTIRVNGEEVFKDVVPAFKGNKGAAELWIGGWSNKSMNWDIAVDNLRIVRRKS